MSWSQVRAVTRVARTEDRIDWVGLARGTSGAQIETLVRGLARAPERARQDCELAAWQVRTRKRYDTDGNLVITVTARPEAAPVIEAAIELKRAELQRQQEAAAAAQAETPADVPAGTPGDPRVTDGAALLAIAQHALDAAEPSGEAARRARTPRQP